MSDRAQWYAELLQAGLETKLLTEADILAHATPAVLVPSLPRDVLASVFETALSSAVMSPAAFVRGATPKVLAEHVPASVLWAAIAAAAKRAGLADPTPAPDEAPRRELLRRALVAGLATGQITAKDIVRHVDAKVLAHSLPDDLTQKLLEASLAAGTMTPELVIDTLGIASVTDHVPPHIVWACVAAAGSPEGAAPAKKQKLEPVDEELASVLVDLDDSNVLKPMIVDAKTDAGKPAKNVVRRPQS
jgi:hypothetical protein